MAIRRVVPERYVLDRTRETLYPDDADIESFIRKKSEPTTAHYDYVAKVIHTLDAEQTYMIYEIVDSMKKKLCTVSDNTVYFVLEYLDTDTFWSIYKYIRSCEHSRPRDSLKKKLFEDFLVAREAASGEEPCGEEQREPVNSSVNPTEPEKFNKMSAMNLRLTVPPPSLVLKLN